MKKVLTALALLIAASSAMAQAYDKDSITAGTLQLVSHQFSFTEGASVDRKGNVFFTDQPNDKIWEYSAKGRLTLFMDSAGRSNGMYFDRKGRLVTCADEQDQLWVIGPHKKIQVLLRDFGGRRFNGPNDLWIDSKDGIYFTDPYYQRDYWTRTHPDLEGEKVYYLAAGAKEAIVAAGELKKPNGIVGTPDGRFLYISDMGAGKTYTYSIGPDGQLSGRTLFCEQGSDGMTLDEKGNVYLTGKGVTIYDPAGKKIAYIPVPEDWTGNLCFGGRDRRTLFITASKGLYKIRMKVKGVENPPSF
jgi:gluconolactonase